jgi:hypothetical protein
MYHFAMTHPKKQPAFWPLGCFAVAFAAIACMRGMGMDHAILYQAGLRVLDGQVLYTDFFLPHGPVSVYLAALFLAIPPTGGMGLLVAAAVMNLAATTLVWQIVRIATKDDRYALVGGILTALWFTPVFGWFYIDHLAYLFVLASLYCLLHGRASNSTLMVAASALCLATAFHTKLTVAVPGLGALVVSSLIAYGIKETFWSRQAKTFIVALITCQAAIFFILFSTIDGAAYVKHTYVLPFGYWVEAPSPKRTIDLVWSLLTPYRIDPVRMIRELGTGRMLFYPIALFIYLGYWQILRMKMDDHRRFALAALILTTLLGSAMISRKYTHMFFGIGGVIPIILFGLRHWPRWAKLPPVTVIGLAAIVFGNFERPYLIKADPYLASTDLWPIRVPLSRRSEFFRQVTELIKSPDSIVANLDDRSGFIPLLAARRAARNTEVLHHDALTLPYHPVQYEAWQRQNIAALDRYPVNYVIATSPVWKGFRSAAGDGSDQGRPAPLLHDYLSRNYQPLYSSDGLQVLRQAERF